MHIMATDLNIWDTSLNFINITSVITVYTKLFTTVHSPLLPSFQLLSVERLNVGILHSNLN